MTELWLIRHGQSESNANGLVQGQTDVHLSVRGREQAQRLARRIAYDPPDLLFASDLSRAFETARAISETCNLPIHPEPRLREIDMGAWANQRWDALATLYPDDWTLFVTGDPHFKRGGGESKTDLQGRMVAAIDDIIAANTGQRIAIVSHGAAIRTYLAHVLGMSLEHILTRLRLGNTSITKVALPADGGIGTVLVLNDMAHLEAWAAL